MVIDSPLPALTSLLPSLLSSTSTALSPSQLSNPVLRRHHFLNPPSSSVSYLQSTADYERGARVETTREQLASSRFVEDLPLGEPLYSTEYDEENRLACCIEVGETHNRLAVLLLWEEADEDSAGKVGEGEDPPESAWRYYDLLPPFTSLPLVNLRSKWHASINKAFEALISAKQPSPPSQNRQAEEIEDRDINEQQEAEDFWAGYSSDTDDEGRKAFTDNGTNSWETENSGGDDYWASYGQDEGTIENSTQQVTHPARRSTVTQREYSFGNHEDQAAHTTQSKLLNGHVEDTSSADRGAEAAVESAIKGVYQLYLASLPSALQTQQAKERFLQLARNAIGE